MEMTNIVDFARRDEMTDALTELLKTGAQALIASAVETELAGYRRNSRSCVLRRATRLSYALDTILPAPFRRALGP